MSELAPGAVVQDRYRVVRVIARGSACVVYCAKETSGKQVVALKTLREESRCEEPSRRRLLREAQALRLARCPQTVQLLNTGTLEDGAPFLALQMLEGRTLEGVLAARGKLSIPEVLLLGQQLCRAIARAHDQGVVHRDIKPGNIILVPGVSGRAEARLIDFRIAAIVPVSQTPSAVRCSDSKITRAGEFFGTPEYAAPEMVKSPELVDRRSDLYSLGMTLYEALTGTVPFSGGFCEILVNTMMAGGAPEIRKLRPEVPEGVAATISRALAIDVAARYQSARELEEGLTTAHLPPDPTSQGGELQRRRSLRVPYTSPVRLELPDQTALVGRSEDLSEGGLLVRLERPCPANALVKVSFVSPRRGQIVVVETITRWLRSTRGTTVVGLEFVSLPSGIRQEIAQFVEQEQKAPPPAPRSRT